MCIRDSDSSVEEISPTMPESSSLPIQSLNPEQQTLATAFFLNQGQNSRGISLSAVFYEWYMREWHTFTFPNRSKEKAMQVQIWKTVAHLKRFVPNHCTIYAKPKNNNIQLSEWNKNLRKLANEVQVGEHAYTFNN